MENLMRRTSYIELKRPFSVRVSETFSGIEPKKPEFLLLFGYPTRKKPLHKMSDPTRTVRFGFNPGTRSGRVPDLPPYYLPY